jgi:hypothetical protein
MFPELTVMNNAMTFEEFVMAFEQYYILNAGKFRRGQALYNFLAMVRPEMTRCIVASHIDPFYVDSNVDSCLEFICQIW